MRFDLLFIPTSFSSFNFRWLFLNLRKSHQKLTSFRRLLLETQKKVTGKAPLFKLKTFIFIISSAFRILTSFWQFYHLPWLLRCEFLAQCKSLQNANTLADRWTLKSLGQGQAWLDRHWVKRSESSACLKANSFLGINLFLRGNGRRSKLYIPSTLNIDLILWHT